MLSGLGDGVMRHSEAAFPFLLHGYSQVFCSTVLLKFLRWTPALPELFLFMDLIVDLCVGIEAGVSYFIILVLPHFLPIS